MIHSHLGRTIALGRPHASPRILGQRRLSAMKKLEAFPVPSETRDWIAAAEKQCEGDFGEFLNDELGICTLADGPAHDTQIWTANNGTMVTVPDSSVLAAYEKICGYDPSDPASDQGGVETNVLAAWQSGIAGFAKLDGWIPVNPQNLDHVRKGIERYGCLYAGVSLPKTILNQNVWTVALGGGPDAEAGSLGGHAISFSAYDQSSFDFVTWGRRTKMSLDFFLSYVDELYAPLCGALWCPTGVSPMGDTADALRADLQAVA
jgi:hypothetical protein